MTIQTTNGEIILGPDAKIEYLSKTVSEAQTPVTTRYQCRIYTNPDADSWVWDITEETYNQLKEQLE